MKPTIRTLAIAIFVTAATAAVAQTSGSASNPVRRGSDIFSYGHNGAHGNTFSSGNSGNSGFRGIGT